VTDADHAGDVCPGADTAAAQAWRDVGAEALAMHVDAARGDLVEALYDVTEQLRATGTVTAEDVDAVRQATDDLRWLLEDYLARVATDAEPWSAGAGATVPYGVMADQLDESGFGYHVDRPDLSIGAETDTDTDHDGG
jgi:hypothetical protein